MCFNGRFYTIKNIWINRPNDDKVGLFFVGNLAEIKNIKLEFVEISLIGRSRIGGKIEKE